MLASYTEALERLRSRDGEQAEQRPAGTPLRIGERVRIVTPGQKYDGVAGTLVKRGRTRYHLRVGRSVMTVPFAMVERA
jgi:hypothetical protein